MKILVTGSRGLIGSHIVAALAQDDHHVLTLLRGAPFPKCDLIVHCAGAAGPWHTLEDIWRDNLDLTFNLLRFANEDNIPMIFMSSIMLYAGNNTTVDESTLLTPDTYYARSKLICEEALKLNIPHVTLRLPGVLGPKLGLRNWLPKVATKLLTHKLVTIYNDQRAFNNAVHVNDLSVFVSKLVREDFDQETFCLAAGSSLTVEQTVRQFATYLKVDHPKLDFDPEPKPHFTIDMARAGDAGYWPMTLPKILSTYANELLFLCNQYPLFTEDSH